MTRALRRADSILREMVALTVDTSLSRSQRTNLETCITVHMHQKESTEDLVKKKVRTGVVTCMHVCLCACKQEKMGDSVLHVTQAKVNTRV